MAKRTISYGKHAVQNKSKSNEVTLTLDTDRGYFSVCGDVWNHVHSDIIMGGQCVDTIVKNYARNANARNIRALWEVFHLRDLEDIPNRFRTEIENFVSGDSDTISFEKLSCKDITLRVTEKVTDYGTYTNGSVLIETGESMETIVLSQYDETKHPIIQRAYEAINWLYTDVPGIEEIAEKTVIETNREEYEKAKEKKKSEKLNEIKEVARSIIEMVDSGNFGDWFTALYEIKNAKRFLEKGVK